MSSVAVPAAGLRPGAVSRSDEPARERWLASLLTELALFAALAGFAMALWARLVEPSSADRQAVALAVVCAGALLLGLLGRLRPGGPRTSAAVVVSIATVFGALAAVGVPAHLLAPAGWQEFRHQILDGIGGIEGADLPYSGSDPWIRLTLVIGAPAMVALAGVIGFWPTRRRQLCRALALALLLVAYGFAATLDNPGAEAFWGIVLLLLVVSWLWVPRLGAGRRAVAVAVTLSAGVLALPLVGRLNGPAWWDYENWSWFGAQPTISFEWNHDYGPLDWPTDGTTVMTVHTPTPLYWKASVLDRFDGYGWQRAVPGDPAAAAELRARGVVPGRNLELLHPGWIADADFELRALSSDLAIGAGTTTSIDGLDSIVESGDGTLTRLGTPLERGEQYSIAAYVPQPTPDQLREAPPPRSERRFSGSTLLTVPTTGAVGGPPAATAMPLWGERDPVAAARLLASPYAETYRLARRWVAGAATPFEAVRAIEGHLRQDYAYTPTVPEHTYPLAGFLFADKAGYCQQFAGTMGLMLRMVGIPSRVVSGFAPGTLDPATDTYEVHDTDAHSWVEVYFRGIGWVTFDPTPNAAPAQSQRVLGDFASAFRGPAPNPAAPDGRGRHRGHSPAVASTAAPAPASTGSGLWGPVGIALVAVAALATAIIAAVSWRRRRRLLSGDHTAAQVGELSAALGRLGWRIGPRTTLLGIERRATGVARAPVRRYAAALRDHRYAGDAHPPPGPAERRALRRALSGGGVRARLRALMAIPPGGPAGG